MLEIHPIHVLSKFQIKHILTCWKHRPSFIKSTRVQEGKVCHTMTSKFFWSCVPHTLHDLVFEHFKRHRPSSLCFRFLYHMHEIQPGTKEDADWLFNKHVRYMIPLTSDTATHGHTIFKNHPDIPQMSPGRLIFVQGKEKYKELANSASTSRIFLSIHVQIQTTNT